MITPDPVTVTAPQHTPNQPLGGLDRSSYHCAEAGDASQLHPRHLRRGLSLDALELSEAPGGCGIAWVTLGTDAPEGCLMPRPHNLEERTAETTTAPWRDIDDQDRGEGCAAEPDPQPSLQQADRRAIHPIGTAAPSSLSLPLPSADGGQGGDVVMAGSRPACGPVAGDPVPLLFTPAQAATALQVRESWLRRRAASREVPCTFLGKHLRFSRADLDQIVADAARGVHSPALSRRPQHLRAPSTTTSEPRTRHFPPSTRLTAGPSGDVTTFRLHFPAMERGYVLPDSRAHLSTERLRKVAWVEKHGDGFRVRYRLPDSSLYSETGFPTRDQADNRAADVESDQRRDQFVDPRLAQTTVGDWIREWTAAHDVSTGTWAKYNSHLQNHILPRFTEMALGDVKRIVVKGWVKTLRRSLAESSVGDVVTLFSMIMGEAVDEGLIGSNPCRKLRIDIGDRPERPHASPDDVDALAGRVSPEKAVLITTAAYTGMRWGELTGLQWSRTTLDSGEIAIDPEVGALHEINGRLQLGPPKTPASIRTVHLPEFLIDALTELRRRNPTARFVFTGTDGGLHRRSNFRRRVWLPALAGNPEQGWAPIQPGMHFHDLRHTNKTWLIEDGVPDVLQHKQMGHKYKGVPGIYSHVTRPMIDTMLAKLQTRWEQCGSTIWADHYPETSVVKIACSHSAPTDEKRPADEDRQQAV